MRPIGKYIIVKDIQEEIKTESGLILSGEDANQLRYKRAEVIAVGTDVDVIDEMDELYYDKAHSFTMLINNEQFTIISERDVVDGALTIIVILFDWLTILVGPVVGVHFKYHIPIDLIIVGDIL